MPASQPERCRCLARSRRLWRSGSSEWSFSLFGRGTLKLIIVMLRRIVVSTPSSFDSDKIIARTPLPCSVLLGSQTVFANHLGCRGTPGRGRRGGLIKSHFIASLVWYSHSVHSLEWCRCRSSSQPVSTSCSPTRQARPAKNFFSTVSSSGSLGLRTRNGLRCGRCDAETSV